MASAHTQKARSGFTAFPVGEPHPDRAQGAGFAGRQISSRDFVVRQYVEARVAVEDRGHASPCWIWQLSLNAGGYGQGRAPGYPRVEQAHRFAYRAFVGTIPPGLHLDHLCRVRACCNPEHLEPVTPAENARRALPFMAWQKRTHCKNGHELIGYNIMDYGSGRRCRTCFNQWQRDHGSNRERAPTKTSSSHCRKGHERTAENTINWNGFLRCRTCNLEWRAAKDDHRARFQRYREEKRAAADETRRGESCTRQRPEQGETAPHRIAK